MRYVLPLILLTTPALAQESHDCVIEPFIVLEVGSAVEGLIDTVNMTRGAEVQKGDILAVLESTVERETLDQAEARARSTIGVQLAQGRLELAQKDVERARELVHRNVGTQSDLELAEANFNQAGLELAQAREVAQLNQFERDRTAAILNRRTVRSPIDGILLRRLIGPGEYVYSQAHIAQIAQIDPLYIDVFLPTQIYDSIELGQIGTVRPAPPIGGVYQATVTAIDKVFDAASDTFGVRLEMPNQDNILPAGVDCKIEFGGS